jgi:hypothetical protein
MYLHANTFGGVKWGWGGENENISGHPAHNVCKTVCLSEELLVYAIRSGQSWQTMGTVLDDVTVGPISPTVDLSKSASRTRKNVLKKQISCLGKS